MTTFVMLMVLLGKGERGRKGGRREKKAGMLVRVSAVRGPMLSEGEVELEGGVKRVGQKVRRILGDLKG